MEFNCLKTTEEIVYFLPLGREFTFYHSVPRVPGTKLIDLGKMKVWVDLGVILQFWTWDPWNGNSVF